MKNEYEGYPNEALPTPIPASPSGLAYKIGREQKRFRWFGKTVVRWRFVSRAYFYHALIECNLISPRSDFEAADIIMLGKQELRAGPYYFRVVPA